MSNSLPDGWCMAPVGDFADVQLGKMLDKAKRKKGERLPYLRNINVRWGAIDIDDLLEMPFTDDELERYGVRPGDVLVCEGGEPGRAAVCPPELVGLKYQKALHRVRLPDGFDPRWLVHQLKLDATTGRLVEHFTGTTIKHFTRTAFRKYEVRLAPLPEQRRIVAKIEALQERSHRARQALEAIPPLLDKFRQSVLAAAFRGDLTADWRAKHPDVEPASALLARIRTERRRRWEQAHLAKLEAKGKPPKNDKWKQKYKEPEPVDTTDLPELPEGWCWASLNELAWHSGYGTSVKCSYDAAGVPVLRIPNVLGARIHLTDLKFATKDLGLPDGAVLAPHDMIIVRTNGSRDLIGRAAVVEEEFDVPTHFASYLIRYRLLGPIALARWISAAWQAPQLRHSVLSRAASSAGQYNVSVGNLNTVPLPVPPRQELRQLEHRMGELLPLLTRLGRALSEQQSRIGDLEQATLARAFRGDLVSQDPADEPASVLLKRIRATSAMPGAKKRPRRTSKRDRSRS